MKKKAVILLLTCTVIAVAGCGKEAREESGSVENYQAQTETETSSGKEAVETEMAETEASETEAVEMEVGAEGSISAPVDGADPNALSSIQDTAPMPEEEISKEDIIGTWVKNPDREEAEIIKIWEENGVLKYQISIYIHGIGDTNTGLANGYTEMVITDGNVIVQGNWGQFMFMQGESETNIFSSYYYTKGDNYIADQKDGDYYYRDDDYVFPFS